MDRMLYLSMTGAKHALLNQQKIAHNLANVDTTGFKSDFAQFISQPVKGPGHESRTYAQAAGFGSNMKTGGLITTGRDLDVAATENTWIAVQSPDGTESYTRRGDFKIAASGLLETGNGDMVLGINGPITIPPAANMRIGVDGSVTVQPAGQPSTTQLLIDRVKLVSPEAGEIKKGDDGRFRAVGAPKLDPSAEGRIVSGTLEGSNVNVVEAMVEMIQNSRLYEQQIKVMKSAEEKEASGAQLLRSAQ